MILLVDSLPYLQYISIFFKNAILVIHKLILLNPDKATKPSISFCAKFQLK